MSIEIEKDVLERACREMIETIFLCLPDAYKGTIYAIGKPPELLAERITSGSIHSGNAMISWGLPAISEYNPPGRPWSAYRDQRGRPLEAMGWCVEHQKSWTSEDPENDPRSVRLQVKGTPEDFHHMEPVLLRKSDLNFNMYSSEEYPLNQKEEIVWRNSNYLVAAVIKIHFRPNTIKIGSRATKVIKKLSRSLGTELLSYQLRQDSVRSMEQMANDRLNACNILADSLRNAITKSGMIFSLVKQEIGFLREQWEQELLQGRKEKNVKFAAIERLNEILCDMDDVGENIVGDLIKVQKKFLNLPLIPEKGEKWVRVQIEERWRTLLGRYPLDKSTEDDIWGTISSLKKSLHFGKDPQVVDGYKKVPHEIKWQWVNLIYGDHERFNPSILEKIIGLLDNRSLNIPARKKSSKTLMQLKVLAETMSQLERNTNFLLSQVLNGTKEEYAI